MIYLAVNMLIEGNFDSLNRNQSFKKKRKEKERSEKENDESQKLFSFRRFK